jgi:branched-chain amino acid aminotransferase
MRLSVTIKVNKMNIEVKKIEQSKLNSTSLQNLGFGEVFTDHMFIMDYSDGKWHSPRIVPFADIPMSPAMSSLHYGQIVFEGLKAFPNKKGGINIFRPKKYHERMNKSCRRLFIPEVDYKIFFDALQRLVTLDKNWIPHKNGESLYIRPFIFATEGFLGVRISKTYCLMIILSPVGAYYKEGLNPIKLVTSGEYVRAVKGGLGMAKTPANYAASLLPAEEAKHEGFSQVLWLDGIEHKYIEEVGSMNICFVIGDEVVAPSLDGTILDGVTRDSVLCLLRNWGIKVTERRISIDEIFICSKKGTLKEVFGTGTAAVISPVGRIKHENSEIVINDGKIGQLSQKLYDELTGIHYGEKPEKFGWCVEI